MTLSIETLEKLRRVSTATLCTAMFKKGLRNQCIQGVRPVHNDISRKSANMVGEAFTLRYIPAREDLNAMSVFLDPRHPQRQAIEQCPAGHVLVIDSRKNAEAASAGAILVSRLAARGCAGIVTDGGFRDSPDIAAMDFAAYHARPSAPTNLTRHQAVDINVPIGCGDVAVFPGDVIVGDAEAVVVIPAHLVDEIGHDALEMTVFEDFVSDMVQNHGRSIVGLYPPTDPASLAEFAAWRKASGL
jgi:regulator of RNase E activity RraA